MSRAYQVRVAHSLTHHVHVEDGIEAKLDLLGIVAPGRMAQLLGDELGTRGFEVENGVAVRVDGDTRIEVELLTGTVRVVLTAEAEVALAAERTSRTYEERAATEQQRLADEVRAELARRAAEADEAARKVLSEKLEKVLVEVKPELDAAVDAVTRAALRERAAQLGQIMEVTENEAGEMTIRVRV